jgi:hypothetical protein
MDSVAPPTPNLRYTAAAVIELVPSVTMLFRSGTR